MEPIKVRPIEGALNFFASGMQGPSDQITTELPDITVDTSLPADTHVWETGIERRKIEGKWVIVEQYPDKPSAEVGHQKWVKMLTEDSDLPIKDVDMWSLGI